MIDQSARFEAPIPGQSLTSEPKLYPWETPPELDKIGDVISFYIERLSSQDVMDDLFIALEEGFPLNILVKSMLSTGVMEGMHTVDVSMVVAPVLHEYILGAAKIQKIKVKEFPETKDEQIDAKEKRALASTIERSLEKSPKEDIGKALLEEALSFVQEDAPMAEGNAMDAPEETTPEEKPMGLMSRRDM
jgi:hypothetical protein|tara:strand:+ start:2209 stop:2778 length:570 start_codon:yes stop_codon:yes gene_type:complete